MTKKNESQTEDEYDTLPVKSLKAMSKNRSFVFYGRSGTGKTTLALTFPGKILILDIKDRGTDSGADIDEDTAMGMSVESWDDFEMVYYYLLKHPKEYKTVIIDTMSQLQQLCVEKVLKDKKKSTARAGDWGTLTKQDWGTVASLMKQWIISYRDLPMEVVFIAQDRTFNVDEEASDSEAQLSPEIGPRLSPSVAAHLNAAVSVVGNTFIREKTKIKEVNGKKKEITEKQYCLRIGPNSVYVTKMRKPKSIQLPDILIDPDYDYIIETLTGKKD